MEPHEVVGWQTDGVNVQLSGLSGTMINIRNCHLLLTNKYIHITAKPSITYTVVGKGDRTFKSAKIPLLLAKPHRFIQPWLGPYQWETQIHMSSLPDVEPQSDQWTLLLTFANGGAFEYRKTFLRLFSDASQAKQDGMEEILPAYTE